MQPLPELLNVLAGRCTRKRFGSCICLFRKYSIRSSGATVVLAAMVAHGGVMPLEQGHGFLNPFGGSQAKGFKGMGLQVGGRMRGWRGSGAPGRARQPPLNPQLAREASARAISHRGTGEPRAEAAGRGAREDRNGHEELEHWAAAAVGRRAADVHEACLA